MKRILALVLVLCSLMGMGPAQRRVATCGPLCSSSRLDNYIIAHGPTLFQDPNRLQYVTRDSVERVSSISPRYGSVAAFTQGTDANKPVLSRPDRIENLLIQSEDFTGSNWNIYRATRTANTTANPVNGATTADTITEDSTAANSHVLEVATANIVSGVAYRFSLYVKQGSGSRNIDMVLSSGFPGSSNAYFNPTTGALVSAGAGLTSTQSEDMGNGWWKFTTTATATSSVTTTPIYIYMASGTTTSYNGDGASSLILFGAQLQRSSMQPTYIATTTVPVYGSLTGRRMLTFDGTDDNMASASTWGDIFAAGAKTAFVVGYGTAYTANQNFLSDAGAAYGRICYHNSSGYIGLRNNDGSVTSTPLTPPTGGVPMVLAVWHDGTNIYALRNGAAQASTASGNTVNVTGSLKLGSIGAAEYMRGQTGPIVAFNRILPQAVRSIILTGEQKFNLVGQ